MAVCRPKRAYQARRLARRLDTDRRLEAVDILPPEQSSSNAWTLDLVYAGEAGGLPSEAIETLAEYDVCVREVQPQGCFWSVVVAV